MSKANEVDVLVSCKTLEYVDTGHWDLFEDEDGEVIGLLSDDFRLDVLLRVSGDFGSKEGKEAYCRLLAKKLNGR